MRSKLTGIWVVLLALIFGGTTGASPPEEVGASRCAAQLDAADAALADPQSHAEAIALYEDAFTHCRSREELPLTLASRLAASRARIDLGYRQDPHGAIKLYEEALEWTRSRGGLDHPALIELLDGLASALESASARDGDAPAAAAKIERARGLRQEALRVREAAHGARSVEAVKGRLLLAEAFMNENPILAEQLARSAHEIAEEAAGPVDPLLLSTLSVWRESLRRQGRTDEADEIRDRYSIISIRLREQGQHPANW